jgi:hypothetical protein
MKRLRGRVRGCFFLFSGWFSFTSRETRFREFRKPPLKKTPATLDPRFAFGEFGFLDQDGTSIA